VHTLSVGERLAVLEDTALRLEVALVVGWDMLELARSMPSVDPATAATLERLAGRLAAVGRRARLVAAEMDG
jgi:hypothetical protein